MATNHSIQLPAYLSAQLAWVAGFLEGEGSFLFNNGTVTVSAVQVQRAPLDQLQTICGGTIISRPRAHKDPRWQDAWVWSLNGKPAAALMMTLYLMMSPKRCIQIHTVLSRWRIKALPKERCLRGHLLRTTKNSEGNRRCEICLRIRRRDIKTLDKARDYMRRRRLTHPERIREIELRRRARRKLSMQPSQLALPT